MADSVPNIPKPSRFCCLPERNKTIFMLLTAPCLILLLMFASPTNLTRHINKVTVLMENQPKHVRYNIIKNQTTRVSSSTTSAAVTAAPPAGLAGNEMRVVSMSLYGSNARYTSNAKRNMEFLKKNFPGWRLRFYTELKVPGQKTKFAAVPDEITSYLAREGAEISYVNVTSVRIPPMMWRFLVADDRTVDVFIVRDCDSHLTRRDSIVVSDWLRTNTTFHCVRDHPSHANFPLSGGMWGARGAGLRAILHPRTMQELMAGYGAAYLQDMNFLGKVIWPKVKDAAFCHDSVSCDRYPSAHAFPVRRKGQEHVGQVFDGNGMGRAGDMNIIKRSKLNLKCIPPPEQPKPA